MAAAASLLVAIGSYGALRQPQPVEHFYDTGVGQRRSITLADSSTVTLNTRTAIVVRYSRGERRIELRSGEAFFDVAHDPARPFIVQAGSISVRALGTAFDVHRQVDGSVAVALSTGKVQVKQTANGRGETVRHVQLTPGEMVLVDAAPGPLQPVKVSLDRELSWKQGILDFSSAPLEDVVDEVNRYSRTRIVIGDRRVSDLRVTGIFNISDSDSFPTLLAHLLPVTVEMKPGQVAVLGYRDRGDGNFAARPVDRAGQ